MKASELIAHLQALIKEHGDLRVACTHPDFAEFAVDIQYNDGMELWAIRHH